MTTTIKTLKSMAASIAVITMLAGFSSCEKKDTPVPDENPIILDSPITENTTLVDLGLPIDYIVVTHDYLNVKDGAVLTVEPGVCIQFSTSKNGLNVCNGGAVKMNGTADKHISLIGASMAKDSWAGIILDTKSEVVNEFRYVDFTNGGPDLTNEKGTFNFKNGICKMNYCTIDGAVKYGIHAKGGQFEEFSNNQIKNCECPIWTWEYKIISPLDITSALADNTYAHILLYFLKGDIEDVTVHKATVPYYVENNIEVNYVLTIEKGVELCINEGQELLVRYKNEGSKVSKIVVNGTAEEPVVFTRYKEAAASECWYGISINTYDNVLNNCIVEYGGSRYGGITMSGKECSISLTDVVIRNSGLVGFYYYPMLTDKIEVSHSNVTFENNKDGNVYYQGDIYADFPI